MQLSDVSDVTDEVSYSAQEQLEYGENAEGYWSNKRCLKQMEKAVKIAEMRYPKSAGYGHCCVLD